MTYVNLEFDKWWCCLDGNTRLVHLECLPDYLSGRGFITRVQFVIFMNGIGITDSSPMYDTFVALYGLIFAVIEVEPDVFLAVYQFQDVYWGNLYLWYTTNVPTCSPPCRILTYSV